MIRQNEYQVKNVNSGFCSIYFEPYYFMEGLANEEQKTNKSTILQIQKYQVINNGIYILKLRVSVYFFF